MTRAIAALVAVAFLWPAAAHAAAPQSTAPPGNSALDQYFEAAPGAAGNTRPRPPGRSAGALTPAARARLDRLGATGRTLAAAVDATSPARKSAPSASQSLPGVGRSPGSAVLKAFVGRDGGSGMGVVLPVILLAALIAAVALVLVRRRRAA